MYGCDCTGVTIPLYDDLTGHGWQAVVKIVVSRQVYIARQGDGVGARRVGGCAIVAKVAAAAGVVGTLNGFDQRAGAACAIPIDCNAVGKSRRPAHRQQQGNPGQPHPGLAQECPPPLTAQGQQFLIFLHKAFQQGRALAQGQTQ